ncbi:MAG: ATP-dependent 6-phosphofructokinase [Gemmatales bacterium]|nr:ATP-dependent 6-phosphofructokinase [Gemmatales bacterium]MCS7160887.1 ATP-dependent 6-phosphofructokinase [Gemmatales bacterium]MDW8176089.1 ATP-dependent 6-phosphofructokinase [Gemmatales bacterium]MDW8223974.1 ATP-dependent 6-phosphofructokinase [Gemmatales bacterium]
MSHGKPPDFAIKRLGKPTIPSPLREVITQPRCRFFVSDEERVLYDIIGTAWQFTTLPEALEPCNLELAGPREWLFFEPTQTTAAIAACGGLCPGTNNVIRGLTLTLHSQYRIKRVLGIRYGFAGLVFGGPSPVELTPQIVREIHQHGGCFLGMSRGPQDINAMVDFLSAQGIQLLFLIGGDGTTRGALALCHAIERRGLAIAVIMLPKTIDNDLPYVEKTFGFETAFSRAAEAVRAAYAEAISFPSGVGLVKLMGRFSGYIAVLAALAEGNADFVLVPEVPFDLEEPNGLLVHLKRRLQQQGHALIVVAEGAGQHLPEMQRERQRLGCDASGNPRLADIGRYLQQVIQNQLGVRVFYIDPSYEIRAQPAIPNDAVFCLQLAQHAVHAGMSGRTGMMVGLWNSVFVHVPLEAVARGTKQVDPCGPLWLSLLKATGQPDDMCNCRPTR